MKPLSNVKIVDMTHAMAGPLCTYQLALLGADVVKVERPGEGDAFRGFYEPLDESKMTAAFMVMNAGKRSVGLDLSVPEGKAIMRRMIERADVLVENYRPGTMAKHGFSWPECKEINPRLIYCSISGFGKDGPYKDCVAYDHTIQAMSGLMTLSGPVGSDEPFKIGFTISDVTTANAAQAAILAALYQRTHSDIGQFIDVAMLDATLALIAAPLLREVLTKRPFVRSGNRGGRGAAVVTLRTRKGWLFIGANFQHQFERLCEVIDGADLLADPRFATFEARDRHPEELAAALEGKLATRTAVEWEPLLLKAGCPAGAVRTMGEIMSHPQLPHRNLFTEGRATGLSRPITLMNAPYMFEHDGPGVAGHVPEVGEQTEEVLEELGYSLTEIEAARQAGAI